MSDNPMNARAAWLEQRRTGLGGSDAPAVLGLSKWNTPLSLWLDKTGQTPLDTRAEENAEEKRWGNFLEPVIKQRYAEVTGRTVVQPGLQRSAKHPFMIANVDGLVSGEPRIVEVKTARTSDGWGPEGTDVIPDEYLIQTHHYMTALEVPVADVAVLIGGSDFRIYTVKHDPEFSALLVDKEREFWAMVEERIAPEPSSYEDAQSLYRKSIAKGKVATDEILEAVLILRRVKQDMKEIEAEEERLKTEIATFLGEHDTLLDANGNRLATWKGQAGRKTIDAKTLEKLHPEIYAAVVKEGSPSRRFLLKGEK